MCGVCSAEAGAIDGRTGLGFGAVDVFGSGHRESIAGWGLSRGFELEKDAPPILPNVGAQRE